MREDFKKLVPEDIEESYSNSMDETLNKINEDLGNESINFYYLNSSKEYRELLYVFLKKNGFNYALDNILNIKKKSNFKNINSEENIKIAKILIDCNIISDDKITVEGNALEGICINYKKYKGFKKDYKIVFNNNTFPLKIRGIEFNSNEIVSIKVSELKDCTIVNIRIDIRPKLENEYNLLENLLIYTDYKLYQFEVKITCNKDFDAPFKNIEEFLTICSKDIKEGRNLFQGGNFEHYLEEINDELSFINYIESKKYDEDDRLKSFLKLVDNDLIHFKDKYKFENSSEITVTKIDTSVKFDIKEDDSFYDMQIQGNFKNNEKIEKNTKMEEDEIKKDKRIFLNKIKSRIKSFFGR